MKIQKKLTSVNVIDDVYKKFKVASIDYPMNLQKLVNRSLDLYNKNDEFRKVINNYDSLLSNDSKF